MECVKERQIRATWAWPRRRIDLVVNGTWLRCPDTTTGERRSFISIRRPTISTSSRRVTSAAKTTRHLCNASKATFHAIIFEPVRSRFQELIHALASTPMATASSHQESTRIHWIVHGGSLETGSPRHRSSLPSQSRETYPLSWVRIRTVPVIVHIFSHRDSLSRVDI